MLNGPDFQKTPLVPVIAQDHASGVVLMLAYMNEEAFRETLASLSRSADALRQSGGRGDEARATLAEISKRATKRVAL